MQLKISLDLVQAAELELDFLSSIDSKGRLFYSPDFIRCAVYRYETLWLPFMDGLKAEEELEVAPPLDVHWVWHVHMLSPAAYDKDCRDKYGRVFDHE